MSTRSPSHDQAVLLQDGGGLFSVHAPSPQVPAAQPPGQLEAVPLTLQQALHILPHLHLSEAGSVVLPHRLLLLAQTLTQVLLFLDLPLVQLPVEQNQTEWLTSDDLNHSKGGNLNHSKGGNKGQESLWYSSLWDRSIQSG